jgi:hypothetical protein
VSVKSQSRGIAESGGFAYWLFAQWAIGPKRALQLVENTPAGKRRGGVWHRCIVTVVCWVAVVLPCLSRFAYADVLTERNGNARDGTYSVPGFNQDMVRDPRWGYRGFLSVSGTVYAQPLYVEGLSVSGSPQVRNVLIVATAKNDVYAFDAVSPGAPLWHQNLGPNDTSKIGRGCDYLSGDEGIGIEATPVIDRPNNRLYVSYRLGVGGAAQQRLRSLDLRSGARLGDVLVQPPSPPSEWPKWNRSRASLLLFEVDPRKRTPILLIRRCR